MAPHLVCPLPFLVPCYGWGAKSPEFLRLGAGLYDLLATDRNFGVPKRAALPRHKSLSPEKLLRAAPGLERANLRGGIIFYDAQMRHCERLTLGVAKAAARAGAVMLNYCELIGKEQTDQLWHIRVNDVLTGNEKIIDTRCIVAAGGPAGDEICRRVGMKPNGPKKFVRGIQLVLPDLGLENGLAVESRSRDAAALVSRGGRSYFLTPWRGLTLAGTFEREAEENAGPFQITPEDIEDFLTELRSAYNAPQIRKENVLSAFGGYIHLENGSANGGQYKVERNDLILKSHSPLPFIQIQGAKYTTFRALGEKVGDEVTRMLEIRAAPSKTAKDQLPGAAAERYERSAIDRECADELDEVYGSEAIRVHEAARKDPRLAERISPHLPYCAAQALDAVRYEAATNLRDIVFRRSSLALSGVVDEGFLRGLSAAVSAELGWNSERAEREVELCRKELERCYALRASASEGWGAAASSPRRNIS